MRQTNTSNSDDTKTVFYYPSHGGYITVYYELALTNYLVNLTSRNYVTVDIGVYQELNEGGDSRNSDDDGDYAC